MVNRFVCILIIMLLGNCTIPSEPKSMPWTKQEKAWYGRMNEDYSYRISLYKGDICDGFPDIRDSSFTIAIDYEKKSLSNQFKDSLLYDVKEIARSYSKIRDFKKEVSYLKIELSDLSFDTTQVYSYRIANDSLVFKFKR